MAESGTILLIDDQTDHLRAMAMLLNGLGYVTFTASSGTTALELMHQHEIDLIIADIAMPHMNGYQLLERVRAEPLWVSIPFVFLTARALDSDIRFGKAMGVDDYLTKPIQAEDLLATIEGKLRRRRELQAGSIAPSDERLTVGSLCLDLLQHQVWLGETTLSLSVREFALLATLARRPGELVSLAELLQETHNLTVPNDEASELLRPIVRALRRKLGYRTGESGCIETVRGLGYRLTPP